MAIRNSRETGQLASSRGITGQHSLPAIPHLMKKTNERYGLEMMETVDLLLESTITRACKNK